jgi:hypothetical protein
MKVLFNKFYRRINLVALLFSNLGSRNKTTYSEFRHLKILRIFSYKVWSLKVPYVYSLLYVESIHAPDLRIRFFYFKNSQNHVFLPIHSHRRFFFSNWKYKVHNVLTESAQHNTAKHKKKPKNVLVWQVTPLWVVGEKSWFLKNNIVGFMTRCLV